MSHIRRMRGVYAERRETLLDAIRGEFGDALPVHDGASGLHLVLGLPPGTNDVAVVEAALARDVVTRPLSRYYQDDARRQPGLLLGYGHVETEAIGGGLRCWPRRSVISGSSHRVRTMLEGIGGRGLSAVGVAGFLHAGG